MWAQPRSLWATWCRETDWPRPVAEISVRKITFLKSFIAHVFTPGGLEDDTGDTGGKKYQFIAEILRWRATATADHTLFTLLNNKGTSQQTLTCSQLHKKAEKIACLLLEKGEIFLVLIKLIISQLAVRIINRKTELPEAAEISPEGS